MTTTAQKGIEIAPDFDGYRISEAEWDAYWDKHYPAYVDYYYDFQGHHPEWKEQRRRVSFDTTFTHKPMTCLLVEGVGFVIE
jgi:hypothetical protein